jgi:hypothetical protein
VLVIGDYSRLPFDRTVSHTSTAVFALWRSDGTRPEGTTLQRFPRNVPAMVRGNNGEIVLAKHALTGIVPATDGRSISFRPVVKFIVSWEGFRGAFRG